MSSVVVGSALAGIAGLLAGYDKQIEPSMGMDALLMAVVVVLVGGKDSIAGIVLAALIVSTAQTVGVRAISSQWEQVITFVVLMVVFLVRPRGLLGKSRNPYAN